MFTLFLEVRFSIRLLVLWTTSTLEQLEGIGSVQVQFVSMFCKVKSSFRSKCAFLSSAKANLRLHLSFKILSFIKSVGPRTVYHSSGDKPHATARVMILLSSVRLLIQNINQTATDCFISLHFVNYSIFTITTRSPVAEHIPAKLQTFLHAAFPFRSGWHFFISLVRNAVLMLCLGSSTKPIG